MKKKKMFYKYNILSFSLSYKITQLITIITLNIATRNFTFKTNDQIMYGLCENIGQKKKEEI